MLEPARRVDFSHKVGCALVFQVGLSVRPFQGKFGKGSQFAAGKYCMTVEDPFAFHENCARSVQTVRSHPHPPPRALLVLR